MNGREQGASPKFVALSLTNRCMHMTQVMNARFAHFQIRMQRCKKVRHHRKNASRRTHAQNFVLT